MNITTKTLSKIAIENNDKKSVWIGIPEISSSVHVGIIYDDGRIWSGYATYKNLERNWPGFISTWYSAQIYAKALKNCSGLVSGNPLLARCSSVFVEEKIPYEIEDMSFVLQYLENSEKDIQSVLNILPPMSFIEEVVSISIESGVFLDVKLLDQFLKKNYKNIPTSLIENIKSYKSWRKLLAEK